VLTGEQYDATKKPHTELF